MLKKLIDKFFDFYDYGFNAHKSEKHTLHNAEKSVTDPLEGTRYSLSAEKTTPDTQKKPDWLVYLILNLVGIVFASSAVWSDVSSTLGYLMVLGVYMLSIFGIFPVLVLVSNIWGFISVVSDAKSGVAFAVAAGSPGAFIAANFFNKNYVYRKIVSCIFIVTVYVAVWLVLSYHYGSISV